jgi:HEAT repeat protein
MDSTQETAKKQSVIGVIVHSFFVVPFLIVVFAVLFFFMIRILIYEKNSAFDYLNQIKTGGLTKRWQAAFELSKMLANPKTNTNESRFVSAMNQQFEHSQNDDPKVREYLSLAMGRSGNPLYIAPLVKALGEERGDIRFALIHALGLLKAQEALTLLHSLVSDSAPRIRLLSVVALGNIASPDSIPFLKQALQDQEPNVQWDAAIALAKMRDTSGKSILLKLLDRSYLSSFTEVDLIEKSQILQIAIQASALLLESTNDKNLKTAIQKLADTDSNINVRRTAQEAL